MRTMQSSGPGLFVDYSGSGVGFGFGSAGPGVNPGGAPDSNTGMSGGGDGDEDEEDKDEDAGDDEDAEDDGDENMDGMDRIESEDVSMSHQKRNGIFVLLMLIFWKFLNNHLCFSQIFLSLNFNLSGYNSFVNNK